MMNLRKMRHVPCKGTQMPFCGVLYDIYILVINGHYTYGYMLYARTRYEYGREATSERMYYVLEKKEAEGR